MHHMARTHNSDSLYSLTAFPHDAFLFFISLTSLPSYINSQPQLHFTQTITYTHAHSFQHLPDTLFPHASFSCSTYNSESDPTVMCKKLPKFHCMFLSSIIICLCTFLSFFDIVSLIELTSSTSTLCHDPYPMTLSLLA